MMYEGQTKCQKKTYVNALWKYHQTYSLPLNACQLAINLGPKGPQSKTISVRWNPKWVWEMSRWMKLLHLSQRDERDVSSILEPMQTQYTQQLERKLAFRQKTQRRLKHDGIPWVRRHDEAIIFNIWSTDSMLVMVSVSVSTCFNHVFHLWLKWLSMMKPFRQVSGRGWNTLNYKQLWMIYTLVDCWGLPAARSAPCKRPSKPGAVRCVQMQSDWGPAISK